ncbi:MAG: diguanylate cyclase [Acidimicrobiales bacterium]
MSSALPHLLDIDRLADAREVPTPPAAAVRILELRSDPNAGVRELARAVEQDPALAIKILATANSAYYRRGTEIYSVDRAISMIGRSSVMTIALAFSVASSIPTEGMVGGVSMRSYWSHSVLTAAAARSLADELSPALSDEAFLVGLISSMGRVVLALAATEVYAPLAAANDGWPRHEVERATLGFSSANAAASILRSWSMPELFASAIEGIERPDEVDDPGTRTLASVTALGADIAEFYIDRGDADHLRRLAMRATSLGVPGDTVDRVLDGLQRRAIDIAEQFAVSICADEYSATIAQARAQLVEQALQTDQMLHQVRESAHLERERREELERTQATFEAEARQDPLTGLPNRRAFDEQLERHLTVRLEAGRPLHKPMGVIMIDLDHFKPVNDTYGHDVGDQVLRQVARAVNDITRGEETIARIGGEEFALFAPLATIDELVMAAERLRQSVAAMEIAVPDGTLRVTASFGVAALTVPTSLDDGARVLKAADEALYEAKKSGRNRVVVSTADLG